MAITLTLPPTRHFPFKPSDSTKVPKLPLKFHKITGPVLRKLPSKLYRSYGPARSFSEPDQAILKMLAESEAVQKALPAVRTYENDLARLTLVGAVDYQQALTAAAVDGGEAADEHIAAGVDAMVVETVFPGSADEKSTVSTRLFLPARKVKEKSKKLRSSLGKDMLGGTRSKNILAMTFRQVVMQQLWNLELVIFRPGTKRDMDNLENPREVSASFTLSSVDEAVISAIAEVVCIAALESNGGHFVNGTGTQKKFFNWFSRAKRFALKDSSVVLHDFLEHDILANAKILLEKFSSVRAKYRSKEMKLKNSWWTSPAFSRLEKIGGAEFCAWISEYAPSYRLEIDPSRLRDVTLEGWKKSESESSEVILTHSQMVCLANLLDSYYEDVFTLPDKKLSCTTVAKSSTLALKKDNSLSTMFTVMLASGFFVFTISILSKLSLPHLSRGKMYYQENCPAQSSDVRLVQSQVLDDSELEAQCISVIRRIKESFGWPGEIERNSSRCSWIGRIPIYLQQVDSAGPSMLGSSYTSTQLEANDEEMKSSMQDIASYQVVLSTNGNIVGFQPTNRVAVNHWAANPLSKELYGRKKLSPGLLEPCLKNNHPDEVIALELLMSVNPDSYFAFVRAVDIAGESWM